jgi:phosphate transport system protein
MGQLARHELTQAKDAFMTRDVTLAQDLVAKDAGIARLNRELFNRAVEIGDDIDVREWAMFMTLVARALERIADNALAIAIAEQTVFVVTGLFREFTDPSQPT